MATLPPAFWTPRMPLLPAPAFYATDLGAAPHGDVACNVDDPESAPGISPTSEVKPWVLRPNAAHLVKAPSGVYHVRLVIPQRVRDLHPGLPREIRRSTNSRTRIHAFEKAQKICSELVTSLVAQGHAMLVNPTNTQLPPKRGFVIEVVDGAIRAELFPGTDAQALGALMQVLPVLNDRLASVAASTHPPTQGVQAIASANAAQDLTASTAPTTTAEAVSPAAHISPSQQATTQPSQVLEPAAQMPTATAIQLVSAPTTSQTDGAAASMMGQIEWFSDAIEQWRHHGPVRFTDQTWRASYAPSFRIARELLADDKHDVTLADGTFFPSLPDIRLSGLTRSHISKLAEQLALYPERQGKRHDEMSAPQRIQLAQDNALPAMAPGNVLKKLEHLSQFFAYAKLKGWIPQEVLDEYKLAKESASARASRAAKQSGVAKPGAVALSQDELRAVFESTAFRSGAIQCDWRYWLGPLRLYTGARVGELSQLFTSDICEQDGVPCISIVEDVPFSGDDVEDEALGSLSKAKSLMEYRRLKNNASRRVIPIHPQLIALGFLEWVAQRRIEAGSEPQLLFAGLTWEPKSGFGRKPSKHMLDLLKATRVWRRRQKVGHSLRANCAQELTRVGMPIDKVQRYLGHSTKTELQASYMENDTGPAYPMQQALAWLQKMDFGVRFPRYAEILQLRRERIAKKQNAEAAGH